MHNRQLKTVNGPWPTGSGQRTTNNGERPFIPYGRQWIDEDDIQAVVDVLRSDWLTTGPKVGEFEQAVAYFVGAKEAVAVNSGTAALHAAMYAIGIRPGDEVILPPMTFVATANAVVFQGGTPVFADVEPDTLLIDPNGVEAKITPRTKAIIGVDYAGHPCDYDSLQAISRKHGLILVADACHSLGAEYKGRKVGTLADLTVFSFHPVKHITTGEGGMITTDNLELADRMRMFRNHGITRDQSKFARINGKIQNSMLHAPCSMPFYYEMQDLGYNYRITDLQCALGVCQLQKLPAFLARRREIAREYDEAFAEMEEIAPLDVQEDVLHAYHLYVICILPHQCTKDRTFVFQALREQGIGVNVHYIPIHLHPFYRKMFGTSTDHCPVAERAYEQIVSLPIWPGMMDEEVERVIEAMRKIVQLI